MNGGQGKAPAEAWQAGDIPSQGAGTQMSHETPGMCVRAGGVGEPVAEVLAWWGSNGLDSEPAATSRFLMRFPINNTRKWLQLNLSAPVLPLFALAGRRRTTRVDALFVCLFVCAAAALITELSVSQHQIYVVCLKPFSTLCRPSFI